MVKTVLIVDDDEDIRLMLRTYLRRFDFEKLARRAMRGKRWLRYSNPSI
ncbi:MAG TPA: hypothetical protein QF604_23735 [Candidatus Latescibacteria bacterium]|jgi:DNA-binding response OmpR family regulator|nr:hypothetical protein [Candidatus Latescibacterota bacterium]MDP7635390.1 hypothetical protein [Candidatus Latescibacterota bacterium]HJN30932.1 hypothetical protein [Candidatus Latescibacterota bacterium]